MIERSAATDNANRLVGRFLQHFAQMELALDQALSKLLKLPPLADEVVLANMDFLKKFNTLFASEAVLASRPHAERASKLRSVKKRMEQLNRDRVVAAHCCFSAVGDGTSLTFRRIQARDGKLTVSSIDWTENDVENKCSEASQLIRDISDLVSEMQPYELSADFSDPRNIVLLYGAGII